MQPHVLVVELQEAPASVHVQTPEPAAVLVEPGPHGLHEPGGGGPTPPPALGGTTKPCPTGHTLGLGEADGVGVGLS